MRSHENSIALINSPRKLLANPLYILYIQSLFGYLRYFSSVSRQGDMPLEQQHVGYGQERARTILVLGHDRDPAVKELDWFDLRAQQISAVRIARSTATPSKMTVRTDACRDNMTGIQCPKHG